MADPKKEIIVRVKMDKRRVITNRILYAILGVLIFYVLTSATVETTTEEVTHKVREPVLVPVVVEREITVQEPYVEQVAVSKEGCDYYEYEWESFPDLVLMKGEPFANETSKENFLKCNVTISNLENKSGIFTFESRSCCDQTREIPAKGSASFQWIHKVNYGDVFCKIEAVSIPKIWKCIETNQTIYKAVTRYREVTKKENVTEYRSTGRYQEVEKTEPVTKYKYYNRIFGYQQFFYLGY